MKNAFLFSLVAALLWGCSPKTVNEWTKWRGPKGDGVSIETNWSADKLDSANILWTANIGFGHSSITAIGNRCFASGWNENVVGTDSIRTSSVYCFDIKTGKEIWKFTYNSPFCAFPGPRSTPVIDGDRLYQISWNGMLYCLNAESGKELWKKDLAADTLTLVDQWGYNPSPVISGNLLLLNLNTSGIALDKMNGKVIWNSKPYEACFASVQLMEYKGNTLGVFQCDTIVRLVDIQNGNIRYEYHKDSHRGAHNDAMFTADGKIFTSNEMLKIEGDSLVRVWKNDSVASNFQTGVIMGNFAYQFGMAGRKPHFCCVDLADGSMRWSQNFGQWGSVLGVGDKLIVLTGLGKVVILQTSPDAYTELKTLQVLAAENKQENWCWTMPAFLDGKLLVRNSKGEMACIDLAL